MIIIRNNLNKIFDELIVYKIYSYIHFPNTYQIFVHMPFRGGPAEIKNAA